MTGRCASNEPAGSHAVTRPIAMTRRDASMVVVGFVGKG